MSTGVADFERRIRMLLKDFQQDETAPQGEHEFVNISTGNIDPPAYIVEILLFGLLHFANYGSPGEKVLWHTFVRYKKSLFLIRDYKFGTWSIEGSPDDGVAQKLANEIRGKIAKAARVYNKALHGMLARSGGKGLYLENTYNDLRLIYQFFEEKVEQAYEEYLKPVKPLDNSADNSNSKEFASKVTKWITDSMKQKERRLVSNYSFALVVSFFSLLDYLIDVVYVFEHFTGYRRFLAFRKRERWGDRFKNVFPISQRTDLKRFYDQLNTVRKNFRNPLSHGLATDEPSLLVQMPYNGLVPLSYEYGLHRNDYYSIFNRPENASTIVKVFSGFLKFFKEDSNYRFIASYLRYTFPIPLNAEGISDVRKKMSSWEAFEKYLEQRARYEDMITNRDY